MKKIKISNFEIGSDRTFIIAEIGNNHNGDFQRAVEMIDIAYAMGADCVKFQMRHLNSVYRKRSLQKKGDDLGTEYVIDLLNRFELSIDEHKKLKQYCSEINLLYLCTPWDVNSIDILEEFCVPAYKVSSADLTNMPLLNHLSKTKKPLILSTGMSTLKEIQITIDYLNVRQVEFILLHCNSTYPAPFHDIHLKWIKVLQSMHPLIGYSGHERGINISIAAVALGSCVIERHFTLSRKMEGPDHAASLEPNEFESMIKGIREIEQAMVDVPDKSERYLSQGEMINRENLGKSLVASVAIKKGTIIEEKHIKVCSPGQGISPQHYNALLGHIMDRDMEEEDFFFLSDLQNEKISPKNYCFSRPWGIPVRYYDFLEYSNRINPDFWEFHLSYSDMDINPEQYLSGPYQANFVVHAPELFSKSRLMDLASPNEEYRNMSIYETQKVIDITRNLKKYFPNTKKPCIIANIGGFSMDGPLPITEIDVYYRRFSKSLKSLDMHGVELIPQTMAPFPWHFGGQRYQNLFMKIDQIIYWCDILNLRMCFDISHSWLACNYFEQDFYDFSSKIAPITAHLHLGDAKGLNGEGLQIEEGEIDFFKLAKILKNECPQATFIPEIWQGHKNNGEGFWIALERLENYL